MFPHFRPMNENDPFSLLNRSPIITQMQDQQIVRNNQDTMFSIDEKMSEETDQTFSQKQLNISDKSLHEMYDNIGDSRYPKTTTLFDKSQMSTPSWFLDPIEPIESQVKPIRRQVD